MAPKRRGRPPKAGKPANEKKPEQAVVTEEPAEKVVEAAKEEEEEEEDDEGKPVAEPSPKKAKVEEKKKRGRQPKAAAKKAAVSAKKGAEIEEKADDEGEAEEGLDEQAPAMSEKLVIIEASKECTCFKTRAAKVQEGLIKAIPGIEVLINPDKPRKGCFEVRSKDGDVYLSMLGLPRPFTKLKNLDMDKAVEEIVAKVKPTGHAGRALI